ncbi:hypothetical protein A3709_07420 [Halioglobus sp. HI00S01]|uniref:hypothetical protein n=1 Tax=Halioglobus sp. HI00S01 TaxID=1822214 RepID=UPI0007C2E7A3|nr:hypothetical protein [Halioglobus sp. HI00S01]KZX54851.1 hypothetical protein A3709_07420 [Halioglobus sp. HI00S01]
MIARLGGVVHGLASNLMNEIDDLGDRFLESRVVVDQNIKAMCPCDHAAHQHQFTLREHLALVHFILDLAQEG